MGEMVVIDASILLLLLRPETRVPAGPDGTPIENPKGRVDYLVERLMKTRAKLVIPTPALAEVLVRAGAEASQEIVSHLQRHLVFQIEDFGTLAAIEVAAMTRGELSSRQRQRRSDITLAKIKYDRQIVAIAKTVGATTIFSDDEDIRNLAPDLGIEVLGIADLPLPFEDPQMNFLDGLVVAESGNGGDIVESEEENDADAP